MWVGEIGVLFFSEQTTSSMVIQFNFLTELVGSSRVGDPNPDAKFAKLKAAKD